jgi:N4-gp56 family major capsid protein
MSTTTTLSNSVSGRYLNDYIEGVLARKVYDILCYPISGDRELMQRQTSITVPFLSGMAIGSSAISQTVDITPQTLKDATASLTPSSRGEAIQDSEELLLTTYTPYAAARYKVIGENMQDTIEAYSLETIMNGSLIHRAAARGSLDAGTSGHRASDSTFAVAKRLMQGLGCPMAPGVAGEGTGALFAILHPDAYYDVKTGGNIVTIATYVNPGIIINNELGSLDDFRLIVTPWAKVMVGAGIDNTSAVATTLSAAEERLDKVMAVAASTNITVGAYLNVGSEETSSTLYPMTERVRYVSTSTLDITFVGQGPNGGFKYDHASGVAVNNNDSVYPIIFGGPRSVAKAYASDVGENGQVVGPLKTGLLEQFISLGWKWWGGYARISENWLARAEVSSSLDA